MMWSPVLLPLIVGLVAASNSGWKGNTEYVYEVSGRTLTALNDISAEYTGILFKGKLSMRPKNDGASLVGHVSDAQYAPVFVSLPEGYNTPIPDVNYKPVPWIGHPFQVLMQNGVVEDLIVDNEISSWEANMLKGIVSQIQVDTQGENLMKSTITQLPMEGQSSAVYKTMEDTVTGIYETLYEVNSLPEYRAQVEPYLVPYPQVKGDGEIIEIIKTKNFSNAAEECGYYYGLGEMGHARPLSNKLGDLMSRDSISRIILTGNLGRYTIQSSVTTNKIAVSPTLINNNQRGMVVSVMNLTLVNIKANDEQPQGPPNPVSLGNLVYNYENPFTGKYMVHQDFDRENHQASYNYQGSEEQMVKFKRAADSLESVEELSVEQESHFKQTTSSLSEPPNAPLLPLYVGYMGESIKSAPNTNIVEKAVNIALEIGKNTENPTEIPKDNTLSKYVILSSLMRIMDVNEIREAVHQLSDKSDAWKVFRDALAECGTGPALLTIQQLILSGQFEDEEAAEVISGMAQSVREPTEEYVRSFYKFVIKSEVRKHPKLNVTSLLRFSELVNNVYVNKYYSRDEYPIASFGSFRTKAGRRFVLGEYIPYLNEQLNEAVYDGDSHRIQVYISALGNVGHPVILQVFEPYLEGVQQISRFQRLHMVNSLEGLVRNYPRIARSLLYKIYQNAGDDPDVRIAAVYQLARTGPSPTMLERMADFTNIDINEQVNAAVKSVIQHVARMNSPQYTYKSTNAKSAKPFLPNREYGPQYSHGHKKSFGNGEKTTFQYIASRDNYFPKSFRLAYRSNYGGLSRQYMSFQPATSSISELWRVFIHQFQEHLQGMQQQEQKSDVGKKFKFSAENIVRMLNIEIDEREQAEGNLMFKIGGYKRLFTVDNHTLEALPEMIKEIQEILREEKDFQFTKFFNRDEIAISFPTEMSLPFLYTFDVPTVLSLRGKTAFSANPDISTGTKLRVPNSIHTDGELQLLMSYKVQGQIGFITPCDHHQYVSGYEKTGHLYLPIKHQLDVNLKTRVIKTQVGIQNPEKNTRLVYYRSKPYTAHYDILNLKPVDSESNVKPVGPPPQSHFNTEFGGQSTGMVFRFDFAGENKFLDYRYIFEQIYKHNYAGIFGLWEHQNMGNREVSLEYVGDRSPNKYVTANIQCHTEYYYHPVQPDFNMAKLFQTSKKPEQLLKEAADQASTGIENAKVFGLHVNVCFEGAKRVNYRSILIYGRSKVSPLSRGMLYMHKESDSVEFGNYYILSAFRNRAPILSEMDAEKVLKSDVSHNADGFVSFGEHFDSRVKLDGEFKMLRTERRTNYLRDSDMYRHCQKDMQEGNKQLYACEKLIHEAKYPDKISMNIKAEEPNIHGITESIYKWLQRHNFIGGEDCEGPTALSVDINFSPDYTELNASVSTQEHGGRTHIKLYDLEEHENNPVTYWITSRLPLNHNRPNCVADNTAIGTFDNLTYQAHLSDAWTVLMVHTQYFARNQTQEHSLSDYMKAHNNYAILARAVGSQQKEIKVYIRTVESESEMVEIDFKPSGKGLLVFINGQQQDYSDKFVIQLYKHYIELYGLSDGEVKLDVKGEFSVVYDGSRAKVILNSDRYYSSVRGICGNANFMRADDFRAPKNCILRTPEEFIQAYTLLENRGDYKSKCYDYYYVYANVISDRDAGRDGHYYYSKYYPLIAGENHRSCMKQQTQYIVEGDQVCFTIRSLPRCLPGCKSMKTVSKVAPVHCVKKSRISNLWVTQIDKGASPDFGLKVPTKSARFDVPQSCQ